jgi:hypothetical protein
MVSHSISNIRRNFGLPQMSQHELPTRQLKRQLQCPGATSICACIRMQREVCIWVRLAVSRSMIFPPRRFRVWQGGIWLVAGIWRRKQINRTHQADVLYMPEEWGHARNNEKSDNYITRTPALAPIVLSLRRELQKYARGQQGAGLVVYDRPWRICTQSIRSFQQFNNNGRKTFFLPDSAFCNSCNSKRTVRPANWPETNDTELLMTTPWVPGTSGWGLSVPVVWRWRSDHVNSM